MSGGDFRVGVPESQEVCITSDLLQATLNVVRSLSLNQIRMIEARHILMPSDLLMRARYRKLDEVWSMNFGRYLTPQGIYPFQKQS